MSQGVGMSWLLFLVTGLVYGVGSLVALGGGIWLLVKAFQTSVGWGLAVFFLPFANIVFAVKHWEVAKKPFLLSLAGAALIVLGMIVPIAVGVGLHRHAMYRPVPVSTPPAEVPEVAPAEVAAPQTDRQKVATLLSGAGIDPANPRTFRGRTIAEMTVALGRPSAAMKAAGKVTYIFYNCFEVESSDGGKTVADVHYMGQ